MNAVPVTLAAQGNSPLQEPENLQVLTKALDKIYAKQVSYAALLDLSSDRPLHATHKHTAAG
jgi:hypothetical protein